MENVLASSTSSFDFSRNDKLTGIKMLLKLKNAQRIYDHYIGGNDNPEEYIDEILKNELKLKNNDNNALIGKIEELEDLIRKFKETHSPEKTIDYEGMIVRMDLQIKEKDSLIIQYKEKLDNIMKNTTFLNFDDREIVNSVSQVLKEKDNVIQNLKDKLIDKAAGNFNYNDILKNKDNNV